VDINCLQSDKLAEMGDGSGSSHRDQISTMACHGHNLLFPTCDGKDDLLPWINKCTQFFHIQATKDVGKELFVSFYMTGDATQ
jgi:hypothetical protein